MNSHNCFTLPALPKIVASLSCDNVKSSWILSTFLMTDLKKKKRKDSVTDPKNISHPRSSHAEHFSFPVFRRAFNLQPFIIYLCTGCFWHCWSDKYAGSMSYMHQANVLISLSLAQWLHRQGVRYFFCPTLVTQLTFHLWHLSTKFKIYHLLLYICTRNLFFKRFVENGFQITDFVLNTFGSDTRT